MPPFTRADYNALIDEVNVVITSPPSGCEPLSPLEHVGPKHRWAKSDIRRIHEAITATCPDITFAPIPMAWKQSTIDEIRDKLTQAWCNCDDDCTDEDGTEFVVRMLTPRVASNCFGDGDGLEPLCSVIGGLSVGRPGVRGRGWQLLTKINGIYGPVAQGLISCQGQVVCGSGPSIATFYGIFVDCSSPCDAPVCQAALQQAAQTVATMPSLAYVLRINALSAYCAPCD